MASPFGELSFWVTANHNAMSCLFAGKSREEMTQLLPTCDLNQLSGGTQQIVGFLLVSLQK